MRYVEDQSLLLLKRGVWIYFLLLIFEGALRKWAFPGLAAPLLIVRDPIAIWILFAAWQKGLIPKSPYLTGMVVIALLAFVTTLLFGHRSVPVALYGIRIWLIHFPLIFVIGRIFDKEDVLQLGRVLLWISIPMVILIALQFYSPQGAWVNRGVGGGDKGAGFSGAMGFYRPPGTFSFTTGNALFFEFVAAFVVYFLLHPKEINKLLLAMASIAVLASIPLSISRSLLFTILVIVFFAVLATLKNKQYAGKIINAGIVIVVAVLVLSQISFFQSAIEAFLYRFTNANESEGGLEGTLGDRYLGGMLTALANSGKQPFFGYGLGMGTNAGAVLLTGNAGFLISEEEWGRVLGEMGTLMGLGVIFIRLGLCLKLAIFSFKKLDTGEMLPWMLLSFGLLTIPQGQWAQPSTLGFGILIGGLIIASMNDREQVEDEEEDTEEEEIIGNEPLTLQRS